MSFINSKFLSELIGTSFLVMVVVGSGIMASNLSNEISMILLANTIATGAGLTALIWTFIKISGAHFNPCVSLVMFLRKNISLFELCNFIPAQLIGGFIGVMLANLMFDLDAFQLSQNSRSGINIFLSESIATFGLLSQKFCFKKVHRSDNSLLQVKSSNEKARKTGSHIWCKLFIRPVFLFQVKLKKTCFSKC